MQTARLTLRPLTGADLAAVLPIQGGDEAACRAWLHWSELNHVELARMWQPPYGDRAIERRDTGELIGLCGLVPSLVPQLPSAPGQPFGQRSQPEVGLYYEVAAAHRRQGYATEAAAALVAFARDGLNVARIVATTAFDNHGSRGVLRRLGMTTFENGSGHPPWLQVVGVLRFG